MSQSEGVSESLPIDASAAPSAEKTVEYDVTLKFTLHGKPDQLEEVWKAAFSLVHPRNKFAMQELNKAGVTGMDLPAHGSIILFDELNPRRRRKAPRSGR